MSRYSRKRNSHRRDSQKAGFTLVELLVVIAIIGTLVALLLPAVQGAREAARRTTCNNCLRNLSLATQQYHDVIGQYPSAWISYVDSSGPSDSWGWGALILPWLDQKNLYDAMAVSKYPLGLQLKDE